MAGDLVKSALQSSQGNCRYDLLYAAGYNSDTIHSKNVNKSVDCAGHMLSGNVAMVNKISL